MRPQRNNLIWAGFALVLLALLSYVPVFVPFPITRDVPWVNYILFLAGGFLLAIGLKRAFRQPDLYRGRIIGTIFGLLSLLLFGFFCYGIFYVGKRVRSRPALCAWASRRRVSRWGMRTENRWPSPIC